MKFHVNPGDVCEVTNDYELGLLPRPGHTNTIARRRTVTRANSFLVIAMTKRSKGSLLIDMLVVCEHGTGWFLLNETVISDMGLCEKHCFKRIA